MELIGIEPTASRVRCANDDQQCKDCAQLERQQTSEIVPKRPILATCSQNIVKDDQVVNLLAAACRRWLVGRNVRELRRALGPECAAETPFSRERS